MTLHYLSDGNIMTSINYRKEIFFVPLIFILKVNPYKTIIIIGKIFNNIFSYNIALLAW